MANGNYSAPPYEMHCDKQSRGCPRPNRVANKAFGFTRGFYHKISLSNSINGLIEKKDFQKAQTVCQQLLDDYPDQTKMMILSKNVWICILKMPNGWMRDSYIFSVL